MVQYILLNFAYLDDVREGDEVLDDAGEFEAGVSCAGVSKDYLLTHEKIHHSHYWSLNQEYSLA